MRNGKQGGKLVPLSRKGKKMKAAMRKTYGKTKGDRVFFATENKKKVRGLRRGN
jgi:hypothetical protein